MTFFRGHLMGIKSFFLKHWEALKNKVYQWFQPRKIEPIVLSKIEVKHIPKYQDRNKRPGWVNNLFDDYVKGKIKSITELKGIIAHQEKLIASLPRKTL